MIYVVLYFPYLLDNVLGGLTRLNELEITVLVDDRSIDEVKLKPTHGISLYIETMGHYILFDTGPNPDILRNNSESLDIDLSLLDVVIVSHVHTPHTGGIPFIGWVAPSTKTYIPYAAGPYFEQIVMKNGLVPIEVIDWIKILPRVYISKPYYGPPWEHFLIIDSDRGLIIFSGCMHPNYKEVLSSIYEYFSKDIYTIIGGFHLVSAPERFIKSIADYLSSVSTYVVPLHCSGVKFIEYMVMKYPEKLIKAMAGSIIKL